MTLLQAQKILGVSADAGVDEIDKAFGIMRGHIIRGELAAYELSDVQLAREVLQSARLGSAVPSQLQWTPAPASRSDQRESGPPHAVAAVSEPSKQYRSIWTRQGRDWLIPSYCDLEGDLRTKADFAIGVAAIVGGVILCASNVIAFLTLSWRLTLLAVIVAGLAFVALSRLVYRMAKAIRLSHHRRWMWAAAIFKVFAMLLSFGAIKSLLDVLERIVR